MEKDIRIIKWDSCPSLSGRSELSYQIGHDEKKGILFRLRENTGSGHFRKDWFRLDTILALINEAEEPFSWTLLRPMFKGLSINTPCFMMAVLKNEGLVTSEKRKYVRQDTKAFMTSINKLIKPAKKAPKKSPQSNIKQHNQTGGEG